MKKLLLYIRCRRCPYRFKNTCVIDNKLMKEFDCIYFKNRKGRKESHIIRRVGGEIIIWIIILVLSPIALICLILEIIDEKILIE